MSLVFSLEFCIQVCLGLQTNENSCGDNSQLSVIFYVPGTLPVLIHLIFTDVLQSEKKKMRSKKEYSLMDPTSEAVARASPAILNYLFWEVIFIL